MKNEALEKKDLGDKLCEYCPLENKGVYSVPGGFAAGCEGSKCSQAYENYLDTCGGKSDSDSEGGFHLAVVTQRSEPLINSDFAKYLALNKAALLFELTNEIEKYCELINGG